MKSLIEIFDDRFSHLRFNRHLADQLYRFQVGFVNKNEEHMAFFGGKLLGVQVVRFTDHDFNIIYNDILDVDAEALKAEVVRDVEDINENFKVSSDIFSLICTYLIHRFMNSNLLDDRTKERACIDCALLFNYRWLTALLRDYFKFPADPKLAQATYANLSNRYLIKKLGSWHEVMYYRANEIIKHDGLHHETLKKYNDDYAVVLMVNDSQGRIRDMVKNIYAEMMLASKSGDKIHSSSSTEIDTDGVDVIKDRVHGLESYCNYLLGVMPDRNSFIKQELVRVIVQAMHTIQERGFVKVLDWMSENLHDHPEIEDITRHVLLHSFNYLLDHGHVLKDTKNLPLMILTLKGVYVSSRSSDPDLLQLREKGSKLIADSIGKTNEQTVAAIRTGVFLYICLRAYTKHCYSS